MKLVRVLRPDLTSYRVYIEVLLDRLNQDSVYKMTVTDLLKLLIEKAVKLDPSPIQRGFDRQPAALEDVGVDHGGLDVLVSEEFLHGADVVSVLQKVGGETVAKGVGFDLFVVARKFCGFTDGFLQDGFIEMMAANRSRLRVCRTL